MIGWDEEVLGLSNIVNKVGWGWGSRESYKYEVRLARPVPPPVYRVCTLMNRAEEGYKMVKVRSGYD